MSKLALVNGVPRMQAESANPNIYDQLITVVLSGASDGNHINVASATAGSPFTLPNSQTYQGLELLIFLNGQELTYTSDYNYVGSGSKTQVSFTFDMVVNDVVEFKIMRGP